MAEIPSELDFALAHYVTMRLVNADVTDARRAVIRAVLHGITHPEVK